MVIPLIREFAKRGGRRRGRLARVVRFYKGDRVVLSELGLERGLLGGNDVEFVVERVADVGLDLRQYSPHGQYVWVEGHETRISGAFFRAAPRHA